MHSGESVLPQRGRQSIWTTFPALPGKVRSHELAEERQKWGVWEGYLWVGLAHSWPAGVEVGGKDRSEKKQEVSHELAFLPSLSRSEAKMGSGHVGKGTEGEWECDSLPA